MSENIKPVAHQYLFTSPFGDGEVWRDNQTIWNGQYAKQSRPLYDQSAIEAARQEGREAVLAELREKGTCVESDLRRLLKEEQFAHSQLMAKHNALHRNAHELRRQLAAAQALVSDAANRLCGHDWLPRSVRRLQSELRRADTTSLDALLAAKERETIERCAKLCESLFDMDDDSCNEAETCAAAIGAMLQKGPSCTRS